MHVFGKSDVKMDKLGRILIPSELRRGLGNEFNLTRIGDKLIFRSRKHGAFKRHFNSIKLTQKDLENIDEAIAEGGMMGNYK
ncbi:MAG: AbrB/MazE/SpoVT family DNA-binding domain-containing protein [Candidatus Micrarchaeota archaeon]